MRKKKLIKEEYFNDRLYKYCQAAGLINDSKFKRWYLKMFYYLGELEVNRIIEECLKIKEKGKASPRALSIAFAKTLKAQFRNITDNSDRRARTSLITDTLDQVMGKLEERASRRE